MKALLRNPESGEQRSIKIGINWPVFFLSPLFGLPLFRIGFIGWGLIMAASCALTLYNGFTGEQTSPHPLTYFLFSAIFILSGILAAKANGYTAQRLINQGWEFVDPTSSVTKLAKWDWRIDGGAVKYVVLVNEKSGREKRLKIGLSWTVSFFAPFVGIPLLTRRLFVWAGLIFGAFWFSVIMAWPFNPDKIPFLCQVIGIFIYWADTYLFAFANNLAGRKLLTQGWSFKEPDSETAQVARLYWRLEGGFPGEIIFEHPSKPTFRIVRVELTEIQKTALGYYILVRYPLMIFTSPLTVDLTTVLVSTAEAGALLWAVTKGLRWLCIDSIEKDWRLVNPNSKAFQKAVSKWNLAADHNISKK